MSDEVRFPETGERDSKDPNSVLRRWVTPSLREATAIDAATLIVLAYLILVALTGSADTDLHAAQARESAASDRLIALYAQKASRAEEVQWRLIEYTSGGTIKRP